MHPAGRALYVLGLFCLAANGWAADVRLTRLPLRFEENVGQADPSVRYLARGAAYGIYVTDHELVTVLDSDRRLREKGRVSPCTEASCTRAVVRMRLVGSSSPACLVPAEPLPGKSNYFIGNDPAAWHTDVQQYAGVRLEDVYPGVDVVYRGVEGQLEYDFIVKPGGDPRKIRLRMAGGESTRVDSSGDLIIHTSAGDLRQRVPFVFQDVAGERRTVKGAYRRVGRTDFAFELGPYDTKRPLVIDPAIIFSTYIGGSTDDLANGVRVDASGNTYVAGFTTSADFPTVNPYQPSLAGSADCFVMKIDSTGSNILYSTYLGGSSGDDLFGLAIDSGGSAYITGTTSSTNYPTASAIKGTISGPTDVFVTKVGLNGNSLIYSTYWGGTSADFGLSMAVDTGGNAYVTGYTGSTDFPVSTVIQSTFGGGSLDAFVTMFNGAGSAVTYSTYLGGSQDDSGLGIAVDSSGNAYVCGGTTSTNFPTVLPLQGSNGGSTDTFVTKIHTAGSSITYSTYLGGSNTDQPFDIAVDGSGNAFVVGTTQSSNFPLASAAQATLKSAFDAYVAKLNSGGSALVFSTFLGGQDADIPWAAAVDGSGNVHVSGSTTSVDFPTVAAMQTQNGGQLDAFITTFNGSGSIVFSTFLGGSYNDYANSIAVDGSGNLYVAGSTNSADFPTRGALQPVNPSLSCGFLAKVTSSGAVTISPTVLPDARAGLTYNVTLTATGGTGPYVFSVADPLPSGMRLTSDALTGSPIFDGHYTFTIRATDALSAVGDRRYVLTVMPASPAPSGLRAIATSSASIDVTWNPLSGASSYRVYRRGGTGAFTVVGTPSAPPFTDSTVAADSFYLYAVTAIDTDGDESPFSNADVAHTFTYTDAPLNPGDTIKAVHITEIRTVVTAIYSWLQPFPPTTFTDPTLNTTIQVKAVHLTELRTKIDTIRASFGLPAFNYTNATITPGVSVIKAIDVQQLRIALR